MPSYRKKPVVIEAFEMTPARRIDNSEWPEWMHRAWQEERETPGSLYPTVEGTGDGTLSIGTLEGQHLVSWGDWIIQGIKGELYPCKPDIFYGATFCVNCNVHRLLSEFVWQPDGEPMHPHGGATEGTAPTQDTGREEAK